ncbi:hypothetical protein F4775DRAFT_601281 [Biscogniauxia sp. FL1348]|nr:hypothetical protein F4775DRAFT_601281 [Biscogniauxia sp. FL1348]
MSFYPNLPDELKLKIWEFGAMMPGVHHFRFIIDRITGHARLLPYANGDADSSSWRERLALKSVHQLSKDALDPLLRGCQKLMFEDKKERHRTHTSENGIKARVDGRADLVMLRLQTDYFVLYSMGPAEAIWPSALAGIERMGLDWKNPGSESYMFQPVRCMCRPIKHDNGRICPAALACFISYIRDLKAFYFVFRLCAGDLVSYIPGKEAHLRAQREAAAARAKAKDSRKNRDAHGTLKHATVAARQTKKLTRKGDVRPAADRIRDVLEQIRAINKRDNLESFQDRKGMYYEVRRKDTLHILDKHDSIWADVTMTRSRFKGQVRRYDFLTPDIMRRQLALDFKFLIFVDAKFISIPAGK